MSFKMCLWNWRRLCGATKGGAVSRGGSRRESEDPLEREPFENADASEPR